MYKRQVKNRVCRTVSAAQATPGGSHTAAAGAEPVSYTHLDVYKRQDGYMELGITKGTPIKITNSGEEIECIVSGFFDKSFVGTEKMCIRDRG